MRELNAKVGSDNEGYEFCMGREGVGERNDNGRKFVDMCLENGLVIGRTIFQHKTLHKIPWISPDVRTSNQINQKWRTSLRDVKAIRGPDASNDHHLMHSKLLQKLRSIWRRNSEPNYPRKRRDPVMKNHFVISTALCELNCRFQDLNDLPADINALCDTVQGTSTPAKTY